MRLTDEEIKKVTVTCSGCEASPCTAEGCKRVIDTIEALQQENEQLKAENASIRNWNACEERLHNNLLESDKRRLELEEELESEKDYREGLEVIIDKLRAQVEMMREALEEIIYCIESGRLCSIGSFNNVYMPQISVSSIERWKESLSADTAQDYHNPADVEALKRTKEALNDCIDALELCTHNELCKIAISPYDMIRDAKEALAATGAIGGKEDV